MINVEKTALKKMLLHEVYSIDVQRLDSDFLQQEDLGRICLFLWFLSDRNI